MHGARKYDASIETYEAGLKLEDSPALRKGLKEVQDAKGGFDIGFTLFDAKHSIRIASESGGDELGLNKLFADPNLVGRLALNPKTAKHLADPSFMQKVRAPLTI